MALSAIVTIVYNCLSASGGSAACFCRLIERDATLAAGITVVYFFRLFSVFFSDFHVLFGLICFGFVFPWLPALCLSSSVGYMEVKVSLARAKTGNLCSCAHTPYSPRSKYASLFFGGGVRANFPRQNPRQLASFPAGLLQSTWGLSRRYKFFSQ